jgi:hypothetical protein
MFLQTTSTLNNGAVYDSGAKLMDRSDRIAGMVFADQSGILFIEQSADGTNWDVSTSYNISASDGKGFSEEVLAPYVRVRFQNNSGSNQTAFRLSARATSAGDS